MKRNRRLANRIISVILCIAILFSQVNIADAENLNPSASAFLYCSYVGCAETDLSPTHFPSCHWFGQLEAVPPLVRVGTHYCRKSSSGLSPSRLSGRGHLFTAECADSFFSGIRNQLHFYPSGHRGGKRRTLLPASGCVR